MTELEYNCLSGMVYPAIQYVTKQLEDYPQPNGQGLTEKLHIKVSEELLTDVFNNMCKYLYNGVALSYLQKLFENEPVVTAQISQFAYDFDNKTLIPLPDQTGLVYITPALESCIIAQDLDIPDTVEDISPDLLQNIIKECDEYCFVPHAGINSFNINPDEYKIWRDHVLAR